MNTDNTMPPLIRGLATTEFWLSAIGMVSSFLMLTLHKDFGLGAHAGQIAGYAIFIIPVGYAIARAWTKAQHQNAVARVIAAGKGGYDEFQDLRQAQGSTPAANVQVVPPAGGLYDRTAVDTEITQPSPQ